MKNKQRNRQKNDQQAFFQQNFVCNLTRCIEPHDLGLQLRLGFEFPPVNQNQQSLHRNKNQQSYPCEIPYEIHEIQTNGTADHDIGRVADQCRGAADV